MARDDSLKIFVPSMSRARNLDFGVARFASPAMMERLTYVVPVEQYDDYKRATGYQRWPGQVQACDAVGIAATRRWIGEHAAHAGLRKFAMIDDDCWFYTRTTTNPSDFHLEYSTPEQTDAMLSAVDLCLDTYAHVAVSAREGNNRLDQRVRFQWGPDEGITAQECTRTLRFLAYQTQPFLACEHGRVEVMEDFDVNLQLLRAGHKNLNLAHWAQGQRQTNAPGGCSVYRSHEVQDRSARRLAELHPEFVRLRQKENKSGGEFGHRTEVTISWQKAYKSSGRSL